MHIIQAYFNLPFMKNYICLENENATAKIYLKGAELFSFIFKETNTEFIWRGNPEYWAKHSPILFPIVGSLKNGEYIYQNETYKMSRHGFARDMNFELAHQDQSSATFVLQSNNETLKQYPFRFKLSVIYQLINNTIEVRYIVTNEDSELLYFSIGAHPALNVPINPNLAYEDYKLHFDLETEQAAPIKIYPLNADGLLQKTGVDFLPSAQDAIPLQKDLFQNDALIFQDLKSMHISIASPKDGQSISLKCSNFPYLGIWSKYGADFVCIEPWQGITDKEGTNALLQDKEGMIDLQAQNNWQGSWVLTFSNQK